MDVTVCVAPLSVSVVVNACVGMLPFVMVSVGSAG